MALSLTTGKIAKYCEVAPRTVSKWIDAGELKGFRLPASTDRRVFFDDFIDFCRKTGYPIPDRNMEKPTKIYIFGPSSMGDYECFQTGLDLGLACASNNPRLVVVIENDDIAKKLTDKGYKVLVGNNMTYNEIMEYLKAYSNAA